MVVNISYFRNHKIGNASGKYDHKPEAFDQDISNSKSVIAAFKSAIKREFKRKYYIPKTTSYGRYLTEEEKIEIAIDLIIELREKWV